MLPSLHNSDLPQAHNIWAKVRSDLALGFKVPQLTPHPHEIIRVYTHSPAHNWQFLLIATAGQTNPPVFSLEMHIYPPTTETYQLNLTHSPIPQPKWSHTWKTLQNMIPTTEQPHSDHQNHIINMYLTSEYDAHRTSQAFTRTKSSRWLQDSKQ